MCENQNKNIFLGLDPEDSSSALVFQCKKCNSILGDSKSWCQVGEEMENTVTLKSKFIENWNLDYHSLKIGAVMCEFGHLESESRHLESESERIRIQLYFLESESVNPIGLNTNPDSNSTCSRMP